MEERGDTPTGAEVPAQAQVLIPFRVRIREWSILR